AHPREWHAACRRRRTAGRPDGRLCVAQTLGTASRRRTYRPPTRSQGPPGAMTRPARQPRLLPTETTRTPAGEEVQMPPTTAPRVGPPGPPPRTGATRPPLPLPRRHSPGEPAPEDPAARGRGAAQPDESAGAWALVKAAQEGDMVAFGELFDRYYDVVFR